MTPLLFPPRSFRVVPNLVSQNDFVENSSFDGNSRKRADAVGIPLERHPAMSQQVKEPGHSLMELSC